MVIILFGRLTITENLVKIGTGLYILKPKYSNNGDLLEYPLSYVKAKSLSNTKKQDGNVFVLRAVIVCIFCSFSPS